jgi:hypothetical protein
MATVWIYVDTSKSIGDRDHLKVFANRDAADALLAENDPEGVAFEYDVLNGSWPTFQAKKDLGTDTDRRQQEPKHPCASLGA